MQKLVPVTIGNILGGVVLVELTYWFVYLRPALRMAVDLLALPHENDPPKVLLKTD